MTHRTVVSLLLAIGGAALISCNRGEAQPRRVLAVYAASSLTEAFEELERGFEAAHPDVNVLTTFAGSQVLRLQIEQGAPADVLASANESHMTPLVEAGWVARPVVFARAIASNPELKPGFDAARLPAFSRQRSAFSPAAWRMVGC